MKPANWQNLSRREKLRYGSDLFAHPKGKFVISQALYYALKHLGEDDKSGNQAESTEDMEILYETIFDQFGKAELSENP